MENAPLLRNLKKYRHKGTKTLRNTKETEKVVVIMSSFSIFDKPNPAKPNRARKMIGVYPANGRGHLGSFSGDSKKNYFGSLPLPFQKKRGYYSGFLRNNNPALTI